MKPATGAKLLVVSATVALMPDSIWACAACYGQSDSAMAAGMNWGIFSLLGIIVAVLGVVAGFFVFLMRRAGASAARNHEALKASWKANWPIEAQAAASSEIEPAFRGGLNPDPILVRKRKLCARSQTGNLPLPAARGRA